MNRYGRLPLLFLALIALLSACGTSAPAATAPTAQAPAATSAAPTAQAPTAPATTQQKVSLKVGATIVPASEVLTFIKDNLAAKEGLDLQIVEFTDFVQPNLALRDKQIDANLFQHRPYMLDFGKQHSIDLAFVTRVYFVRLGLYSKKITSLKDIPEGGVVAVPNDVTNVGRALRLLEKNGLITIKPDAPRFVGVKDIATNPKKLQFVELEAPQLPRSLDDTVVSAINGNFALQAGLEPSKDALALEDDPGANAVGLATLQGQENNPGVQILARLLHDPSVQEFIKTKYKGAVLYVGPEK